MKNVSTFKFEFFSLSIGFKQKGLIGSVRFLSSLFLLQILLVGNGLDSESSKFLERVWSNYYLSFKLIELFVRKMKKYDLIVQYRFLLRGRNHCKILLKRFVKNDEFMIDSNFFCFHSFNNFIRFLIKNLFNFQINIRHTIQIDFPIL